MKINKISNILKTENIIIIKNKKEKKEIYKNKTKIQFLKNKKNTSKKSTKKKNRKKMICKKKI